MGKPLRTPENDSDFSISYPGKRVLKINEFFVLTEILQCLRDGTENQRRDPTHLRDLHCRSLPLQKPDKSVGAGEAQVPGAH